MWRHHDSLGEQSLYLFVRGNDFGSLCLSFRSLFRRPKLKPETGKSYMYSLMEAILDEGKQQTYPLSPWPLRRAILQPYSFVISHTHALVSCLPQLPTSHVSVYVSPSVCFVLRLPLLCFLVWIS